MKQVSTAHYHLGFKIRSTFSDAFIGLCDTEHNHPKKILERSKFSEEAKEFIRMKVDPTIEGPGTAKRRILKELQEDYTIHQITYWYRKIFLQGKLDARRSIAKLKNENKALNFYYDITKVHSFILNLKNNISL